MNEGKGVQLKDKILDEYTKGNLVFMSSEGPQVTQLNNFLAQPIEGMLYDLNRLEEVTLTFVDHDIKWVNDYAVAKVIRVLYSRVKELEESLKKAEEQIYGVEQYSENSNG